MTAKAAMEKVNANTILLTVGLAMSGWTLNTVEEVKNTLSRTGVMVDVHEREINELKSTFTQHEIAQNERELASARAERTQPTRTPVRQLNLDGMRETPSKPE